MLEHVVWLWRWSPRLLLVTWVLAWLAWDAKIGRECCETVVLGALVPLLRLANAKQMTVCLKPLIAI